MKLIDISTRKHPNTFAMVDDEDFDFLNQWKWYAANYRKSFYAERKTLRPEHIVIRMHRAILNPRVGLFVDHIDGNGLNNTRKNLRECSNTQNQHNQALRSGGTSKYKGVCGRFGKWVAKVRHGGRSIHLGCFQNESDAALAYNKKAAELFGEFANLNKILEETA